MSVSKAKTGIQTCYTKIGRSARKTAQAKRIQELARVARLYIFAAGLRQPYKGYSVCHSPGAKRRLPLNPTSALRANKRHSL